MCYNVALSRQVPGKEVGLAIGNMENLQEERVINLIREVLEEDEFVTACRCQQCFIDMAAIALNKLPPEYVSDKFLKFPEPPEMVRAKDEQAMNAIRDAARKVRSNPHHE